MICSKLVSPSPNPHKTYQANPVLGMHSTIKTNLLGSTITWEAWEEASQEGIITTTGEEETGFRLATTTPGVPTITITLGGTITTIIAGGITATIITGGTLEDGVTITSRSEAWGA